MMFDCFLKNYCEFNENFLCQLMTIKKNVYYQVTMQIVTFYIELHLIANHHITNI